MQRIDEAPEQALPLVGELRAVRCDDTGQDVDGFFDAGQSLFLVPDLAVVELVGTRGGAEQGGLFASYCGLRRRFGADEVLHDSLHCYVAILRGGLPRRDDSLDHALAAEPRWPECLRWGDGRVVRAQGAERASHGRAFHRR